MSEYRILIQKLFQSDIIEANSEEEAYKLFIESKPKTIPIPDAEFPVDVVEIGLRNKAIIRVDPSYQNPKNHHSHSLVCYHIVPQMEKHPQFKKDAKQLELEYEYLRDKYPYPEDIPWQDAPDIPYNELFDVIEKFCKIVDPPNLRETWVNYQKKTGKIIKSCK